MFKPTKKLSYHGIAINANRFSGCQEDATLYVLFQDGTKLKLKQWNEFNCEGNVFLDFDKTALKKLAKPIKALKLVNGRDYEDFEKTLTEEEDINYFINVIDAINNKKIEDVKELTGY